MLDICKEELGRIRAELLERARGVVGISRREPLYEQLERLRRVRFEINPRLTSTAGRAFVTGPRKGLVEISGSVFSDPRNAEGVEGDLRNTIRHELAHIAAPDGAHHGPTWKRIAREFGCTADRCHSMATKPKGQLRLYKIACKICDQSVGHLARRNTPTRYISRRLSSCCGGRLYVRHSGILEENEPTV